MIQEQVETGLQRRHVEHREPAPPSTNRYIINLHSFHHPHLIRRVLPRTLTAPIPLLSPNDRQERHNALADAFKEKSTVRKQATADKKKAAAEARLKEGEKTGQPSSTDAPAASSSHAGSTRDLETRAPGPAPAMNSRGAKRRRVQQGAE
jgi:hypothetical protein